MWVGAVGAERRFWMGDYILQELQATVAGLMGWAVWEEMLSQAHAQSDPLTA